MPYTLPFKVLKNIKLKGGGGNPSQRLAYALMSNYVCVPTTTTCKTSRKPAWLFIYLFNYNLATGGSL